MNYICRVCESIQVYLNLFEDSNKLILHKLKACANVQFDPNDFLPKLICKNCIIRLEFAYSFKTQCEDTDKKLREILEACEYFGPQYFDDNIEENEEEEEDQEDYNDSQRNDETNEVTLVEFCPNSAGENKEKIEIENSTKDPIIDIDDKQIPKFVDRVKNDAVPQEKLDNVKNRFKIIDEHIVEYQNESTDSSDDDNLSTDIETIKQSSTLIKKGTTSQYRKKYKLKNGKIIKVKQYPCVTCNAVFDYNDQLNEHTRSHGNRRFKCPHCDKWFGDRSKLKMHQTTHQDDKNFQCHLCPLSYKHRPNLDRHIRIFHNEEKKFVCEICGKRFGQSFTLKFHQYAHSNEKLECYICHKWYKLPYLNQHMKSHSLKEQPTQKIYFAVKKPTGNGYLCPFCGKKLNFWSGYQSHLQKHTGEKPNECSVCNKRFRLKLSLQKHLLIHSGERPYRCDLCQMSFRQIEHLRSHQLIHSGVKQHKCLICAKTFSLRCNLTVHMRLHTGETPYHCTQCPKQFSDVKVYKRHKLFHCTENSVEENNAIDSILIKNENE